MLNEASEITLISDKRWRDLGYIHNTINDIEVELKKEMNKRDHHKAKKSMIGT